MWDFGAGLHVHWSKAVFTASTLHDNVADDKGGAVLASNYSVVTAYSDVIISGNTAGTDGGGIYLIRQTWVELNSSSVLNNLASTGGGIAAYGGVRITLNNSEVARNQGYLSGGGISLMQLCSLSIFRSMVVENIAGSDGGGIFVYERSELQVSNCTLGSNEAGNGGSIALYFESSLVLSSHSTIFSSLVTGNGGAIWLNERSRAVINDTLMEANNAGGGNGGHFFLTTNSSVEMSDAVLIRGDALHMGGAVYANKGALVRLRRTHIAMNHAENGAGLFLDMYASAVVEEAFIFLNLAELHGGGGLVWADCTLTMRGSQVMGCAAKWHREVQTSGGGILVK
ncbi:hypothetical protein CYMTET_14741, partial [Cymbomonas tetramitiformis]